MFAIPTACEKPLAANGRDDVRKLALILLAANWSAVASAQTGKQLLDEPGNTSSSDATVAEWSLELAPSFGRDIPFADGDELIDEGEYSFTLSLHRKLSDQATFSITPGVSFSPNFFVDDEPSSALFTQFKISAEDKLVTAVREGREAGLSGRDTVTPFGSYKFAAAYQDGFEKKKHHDHLFTLGLTYKNVIYVLCEAAQSPSTTGCSGASGMSFSITPAVELTESTQQDRERITPRVKAEFGFPVAIGLRFNFEAVAEARFFDIRTASGDKRTDYRFSGFAGMNFGDLLVRRFGLPAWVKAKAGMRVIWNESNEAGKDFTRAHFLPVVTFGQKF